VTDPRRWPSKVVELISGLTLLAALALPRTWWGLYLEASYFSAVYELVIDKNDWSFADWAWRQLALTIAALLLLALHLGGIS